MAINSNQQEIELLRKQLEKMKREREAEQAAAAKKAEESTETAAAPDSGSDTAADDSTEDLVAQFKDLLESIDKDIKDTKPSTLLIVFALGVIVGRL